MDSLESLEQRIQRLNAEHVEIVQYDPGWPELFKQEREHLLSCIPAELVGRVEHFGSTAVPSMAAKPIVDMLVEVRSLDETKRRIVPILEAEGYDYLWRPTFGDDVPPWYAWFIKRNANGVRTHHIHMIERDFEHWDRLLFRDYLIENASAATEYGALKRRLASYFPNDRTAYTNGKSGFIARIMAEVKGDR